MHFWNGLLWNGLFSANWRQNDAFWPIWFHFQFWSRTRQNEAFSANLTSLPILVKNTSKRGIFGQFDVTSNFGQKLIKTWKFWPIWCHFQFWLKTHQNEEFWPIWHHFQLWSKTHQNEEFLANLMSLQILAKNTWKRGIFGQFDVTSNFGEKHVKTRQFRPIWCHFQFWSKIRENEAFSANLPSLQIIFGQFDVQAAILTHIISPPKLYRRHAFTMTVHLLDYSYNRAQFKTYILNLLPDLTTYDTVKHLLLGHTSLEDNWVTHTISR